MIQPYSTPLCRLVLYRWYGLCVFYHSTEWLTFLDKLYGNENRTPPIFLYQICYRDHVLAGFSFSISPHNLHHRPDRVDRCIIVGKTMAFGNCHHRYRGRTNYSDNRSGQHGSGYGAINFALLLQYFPS